MAIHFGDYRGRVTLADGAWGTMLLGWGATPGALVEPWNLTRPADVRAVATAYVEAGAQVILTNTFRANRLCLRREGLAEQVRAINEAGARLSKEAAGDRARVFGSVGPSGKLMMMQEITPAELEELFAEQAVALQAGGVDAVVCETFFDPAEIALAVRSVKAATTLPVVGSMTFDSGKDQAHTMTGATPEQAVEIITEAGADAVGCNCGTGIDGYLQVVARMRRVTDLPIWVKPNAGLPELMEGNVVYRETPEEFARRAPALIEAGADIVGGCCGTDPDFIRALATRLGLSG